MPLSQRDIDVATFTTRFWSNVLIRSVAECWPWLGYKDAKTNYGYVHFDDQLHAAHAMAITLTTGETRAPGLETCHACNNPPCCNPHHLRFDTRQSNVDDMMAAGHHRTNKKLTIEQVVTIRERAAHGASGRTIARDYSVTEGLVTMIIRGQRWPTAPGPIRTHHGNRKTAQHEQPN